jgi:hypothetical protein
MKNNTFRRILLSGLALSFVSVPLFTFAQAVPVPSYSVYITSLAGSQKLEVGDRGTWTVNIYSQSPGVISYTVDWGDGQTGVPAPLPSGVVSTNQSATFTHRYAKSGTFAPKFTVTLQDTGVYAQTSTNVKVVNDDNRSSRR